MGTLNRYRACFLLANTITKYGTALPPPPPGISRDRAPPDITKPLSSLSMGFEGTEEGPGPKIWP